MEWTQLLILAKHNFEKDSAFLKTKEGHHRVGLFLFPLHGVCDADNDLVLARRIPATS